MQRRIKCKSPTHKSKSIYKRGNVVKHKSGTTKTAESRRPPHKPPKH